MKLIVAIILFSFGICTAQTCEDLSESFISYKQAIETIKRTNFTLIEHCDTSKSSWVRSAYFYSCDSRLGYLILSTNSKSYIHKGVPKYLWEEFKNAPSFGSFYNAKFKGRYPL